MRVRLTALCSSFWERFFIDFGSIKGAAEPDKSSLRCSEFTIFHILAFRENHRFRVDQLGSRVLREGLGALEHSWPALQASWQHPGPPWGDLKASWGVALDIPPSQRVTWVAALPLLCFFFNAFVCLLFAVLCFALLRCAF